MRRPSVVTRDPPAGSDQSSATHVHEGSRTNMRCWRRRGNLWIFLKTLFLWSLCFIVTSSIFLYTQPPQIIIEVDGLSSGAEGSVVRQNAAVNETKKVLGRHNLAKDEDPHHLKHMYPKDLPEHTEPQLGPMQPDLNPMMRKTQEVDSLNTIYGFVSNVEELCNPDQYFVLAFVHSKIDHFQHRELIRQSWGRVKSYKGHQIRTVFILALPDPQLDQDERNELQQKVTQEKTAYDDIVQGDFVDHYRNLTSKHLLALKWILTYCQSAKYIVKVDDDTLVNIFNVVDFLTSPEVWSDNEDLFYCSIYYNPRPVRNPINKWYVDHDEYPDDKYPTYCGGFAYITTPKVVHKVYHEHPSVRKYWIDDVYVTGMLAQAAKVTHKPFRNPNGHTVIRPASLDSHHEMTTQSLFMLSKRAIDTTAHTWMNMWHMIVHAHPAEEYTINERYQIRDVQISYFKYL